MPDLWSVNYSPKLTDDEREQLEALDSVVTAAYQASVYWSVVLDSKGRRYLRALKNSNHEQCLGQFILVDIQRISDEEIFKSTIIAGKFPCQELP